MNAYRARILADLGFCLILPLATTLRHIERVPTGEVFGLTVTIANGVAGNTTTAEQVVPASATVLASRAPNPVNTPRTVAVAEVTADQQVESQSDANKDIWDKLEAISGILSGVIIALVGILATHAYQIRQSATEERQNEHSRNIARIQTIETLLPYLSNDDDATVVGALKTVARLDPSLAIELAEMTTGDRRRLALFELAVSSNDNAARVANDVFEIQYSRLRSAMIELRSTASDTSAFGIAVVDTGYVVVPQCLVARDARIELKINDVWLEPKIRSVNATDHLALVELKDVDTKYVRLRANAEPVEGDVLYIVNVLDDHLYIASRASVVDIIDSWGTTHFMRIGIVRDAHFLGCPVLDRRGQVVGIIATDGRWMPSLSREEALVLPTIAIDAFIHESAYFDVIPEPETDRSETTCAPS